MTPSAPAANAVRETFLAAVRAAELFTPAQLARAEAAVPADVSSPADAARALVSANLLTKFQAERLLAGKTDGYHLGPYVILDQLGRGPTGRVYKARHRTMNRPVAVKVLAAELTRTAADRQAFQNEVRAAAQLNHPNVVTAYDANELAGRFYVVVEFVDGPDLASLVKERGPLPVAEACELARQAAAGLDHAHGRGMVHRDLKPTNLLVARPKKQESGDRKQETAGGREVDRSSLSPVPCPLSPDLKISDFGLAKLSAAALVRTPMPGTEAVADYVAPEQAHHPALADHRADLYSLGAVLYFLLTGRPPFAGGTLEEKVRRHLWEEPPRLELVRPDVPPALAVLIRQLLAKNPAHRPGAAAEVADRLAAIGAGFGDAVCLDLPAHAAPYPQAVGPLSAVHAVSSPHAVAPTPLPAETSPWEQMAGAASAEEPEVEGPRRAGRTRRSRRGRNAGMPPWMVAGLAVAFLGLCLAVAVIVKVVAK
jgi:serine/threonine-protein kinase